MSDCKERIQKLEGTERFGMREPKSSRDSKWRGLK